MGYDPVRIFLEGILCVSSVSAGDLAHLHRSGASDTLIGNEDALESSYIASVFVKPISKLLAGKGRRECPLQSAVAFGITSESGKRQRDAQGFDG